MKETDLINQITPSFYRQSSVVTGIGDDGAVIKPPNGHELVIVADAMIEDVHFSLNYMNLSDVGHRVLAANVSDLIAMGSKPLYYIITLGVPSDYNHKDIQLLYDGLNQLAKVYNMDLIGGDTTSSNKLMISITAFGSVLPNRKRLRSQADAGDVVFVTGYLGESGYGLHLLNDQIDEDYFINRHKRPVPRQDFLYASEPLSRVCLNDISDGISTELNEIAEASLVNIEINYESLPVHEEMKKLNSTFLKELILSAGEDFELVGTCSVQEWKQLEQSCQKLNIPIKSIGTVTSSSSTPKVNLIEGDQITLLDRKGYEHS
ncbi:thiamine-phosphate kinase [Alkalibacillus haloalkaliphilus]|uniref:Thiamine-monophosphate kinase n=1 Tax=Alkalibacillus haloalkaliphilus TaxID=94136 RepID=A0A511W5A1_9BACI|nr:thiamine-phosphate kinase [Alkalibacillus haloalkaliphilus]GEN46276.1 thiamine-monophosphate kinase [Alkalibacillus haloalkaliphilus]